LGHFSSLSKSGFGYLRNTGSLGAATRLVLVLVLVLGLLGLGLGLGLGLATTTTTFY
jgi:hypothetical protein